MEDNQQQEMQQSQAQRPTARDPLLGMLVQLTEGGFEISVGLVVGGVVITGMLTSGRNFLAGVAESLENARTESEQPGTASPELADAMAPLIEKLRGDWADTFDKAAQDRSGTFIHLRNATIAGATPISVPWWRGNLSAVQGYYLGTHL